MSDTDEQLREWADYELTADDRVVMRIARLLALRAENERLQGEEHRGRQIGVLIEDEHSKGSQGACGEAGGGAARSAYRL